MAGIYIPDLEFPSYPWTGHLVVVLDENGTAHFTKAETLERKTVNYTVVPNHGDLIDKNAVLAECEWANMDDDTDVRVVRYDIIKEQPSIIETDRKEEDSK